MKAARIHRYGGPEVLQIDEVPEPQLRPGDVLVRVHASSINPVDGKIRSGSHRALIPYTLPHTLGLDVSGTVAAVGAAVTGLAVGDEVWGSPTHKRQGTYAELVAIDAGALALKPKRLTHEEAAALPLVALTAWQALVVAGRVRAGERVLITAASGGVGTVAVQLAKHLGAHVTAVCSSRNAALVRELGASEVIDYTTTRFEQQAQDVDLVLDCLGGDDKRRALATLRRGGRLVSIVGGVPQAVKRYGPVLGVVAAFAALAAFAVRAFVTKRVVVKNAMRASDGVVLGELTRLVDAGHLRPVIDRVVPLSAIAEAHRYVETGRARGKVVCRVA